jgi:CheY-like chemotaxis protein
MPSFSRHLHVLVVEDDAAFRELLAVRLRHLGIEVATAGSVPEAIETLEETHVDAVLSDYVLPGPSGLALLAYVRRALPLVPFVLMSASLDADVRARAIIEGAEAVHEKRELLPLLPQLFERFPAAA